MNDARIRLAALEEGANPLTLELDGAALGMDADDDVAVEGRVLVDLEIVKVGETIDVRGVIRGRVLTACSRCAEDARIDLDVPVRLVAREREEDDRDPVVDDEDLVYHDGALLDLADALRQLVLVSVPMAPLCREECRGLCPMCGTDLNVESCDCRERTSDPRWRALDELLERERES